jgi:hypothetical protein
MDNDESTVPKTSNNDLAIIAIEGGFPMDAEHEYRPLQLIDGGNHHQDQTHKVSQHIVTIKTNPIAIC